MTLNYLLEVQPPVCLGFAFELEPAANNDRIWLNLLKNSVRKIHRKKSLHERYVREESAVQNPFSSTLVNGI